MHKPGIRKQVPGVIFAHKNREQFYSKLTACSTCRLAGRKAIHGMKVEDFHGMLWYIVIRIGRVL